MSMHSLDGAIRDGRHRMQIRVYYEDTDFSGIVYHANYLRFMDRGRTNHLRLMGAEQHALFAEAQAETPGFAFVVRSLRIDYRKPARMCAEREGGTKAGWAKEAGIAGTRKGGGSGIPRTAAGVTALNFCKGAPRSLRS